MRRRRRKPKHQPTTAPPGSSDNAQYPASRNIAHKPKQPRIHPWELAAIEPHLLAVEPRRTYLEIGSFLGGSLRWFSRTMEAGARLISVDGDARESLNATCQEMVGAGFEMHQVTGNTQSPEIVEQVRALLSDRKVDILLIDADHSAMGVMRDIANYVPMVRKGGVAVFHDAGLNLGQFKKKYYGIHGAFNTSCVGNAVRSLATGRRSLVASTDCGTAVVWM